MLTFVVLLAIMSTALELMIAARVPAWRRLSHKNQLFNLLNSMFISYLMGIAFGAAGLIAMTSGVVSTMLSVPGYQFLHWNYDSPQAQKVGGNIYAHNKTIYKKKISNIKQTIFDIFNLIYKILKIITAPIWITRLAFDKINNIRSTS